MKNKLKKVEEFQDYLTRIYINTGIDQNHTKMARNITFQVTEDCNMNCTYCYQGHKQKNSMTFDIAKRFIDMILDQPDKLNNYCNPDDSIGVILEFIGGEPFLEVELIDKIVDYFRKRLFLLQHHWATKLRLSISSNGLLYFEPKVQEFIKKNKDILSLSITIDGNKKLHDTCRLTIDGQPTYDRAIKAVKHYRNEIKGYMGSKMTLAPQNIQYTSEAIISLIENDYNDIFVNCVFEKGWKQEHSTILYYELKKIADYLIESDQNNITISIFDYSMGHPLDKEDNNNWCGGSGDMISIDYKGDIYPCIRYMESSLNGEQIPYKIGDVYNGIAYNELYCSRCNSMTCITRRSQSTDECFDCPIASGCAWCSAYNYQVTGDINKRVTYICEMHKATILANSYYWNNLYKKNLIDHTYHLYIPEEWALKIIDKEEYEMLKELEKEVDELYESNNSRSYSCTKEENKSRMCKKKICR